MRSSINDIKTKYTHLEDHVLKEIRDELEATNDLEEGAFKPSSFVQSTDANIYHTVRIAQEAPLYWKALCGWKFGVAR